MSDLLEQENSEDKNVKNPCSGIQLIIEPKDKDLGGFSVRRVLPAKERRQVGPWVFFDHMGPAEFDENSGLNVRPHPHINLATVTYLFDGEILHRDSLGTVQLIQPGAINLMVAGKGITHSEREQEVKKTQKRSIHALQLWLALPEEEEEVEPQFFHYPADSIPVIEVNDVSIRVMMGKAYGTSSPVKTFSETLYVEVKMKEGQKLNLPKIEESALYVVRGELKIENKKLKEGEMAVLEKESQVQVEAQAESLLVLVGGEKLNRRHVFWNFVSSRKERIEQAKKDWKEGRFAKVPGDEKEFIPLPE